MTENGATSTGETPRTTIRCFACGNEEETLKEHKTHLADADHPDKGEKWVR